MNIDLTTLVRGDGCTMEDYLFLFGLVSTLRPKLVAEVGTNQGASSIVMAKAMKMFNIKGKIFTCDTVKEYVSIAKKEISKANLNQYIIQYLGTVGRLPNLKYDLAFIDGSHTYQDTKKDFKYLKDKCKYILFHDVYSCEGKEKLFEELEGEKISFIKRPAGHLFNNGELKRHTSYQGFGLWKNLEIK